MADDTLKPGDPGYTVALWRSELERAEKAFEGWVSDAEKVVERYALDNDRLRKGQRLNILWSNVRTLAPALYANPPKAVAQRRYLDRDPIGRVACRIIQRAVQYQVDTGELNDAVKLAVMDRLLGGRGQVWCRYEPIIEGGPEPEDEGEEGADAKDEPDLGEIVREMIHVDYVHWKDFRHDPARTWDEVTWVGRRSFMTRDALVDRFGDVGETVALNCGPDGKDDDNKRGAIEELRKAEVWEIWNRTKKQVVWLGEGVDEPLDERDDPYKLEAFFPCPKPLYATVTTEKLVPTPDFLQYRSQADQMDRLAKRIDRLTDACKVRGAYNLTFPTLARILEGDENDMVPVEDWAAFKEGQGMQGAMDFVPIEMFANVLKELFTVKAEVKADIYETTGISDILRGQGDPDETAMGVQTKGHFATLRLQAEQREVARFVRDVVRTMAELTCELFQPETLAEMASCQEMEELQIPAPMPPPVPMMGGVPPPMMPPPAGGAPMMPQRLPMGAGPGIGA